MSNPQYCQVVFGPEARLRVWFVLHEDAVYLDHSGGDAPDTIRCLAGQPAKLPIELDDPDGRTRYTLIRASLSRREYRAMKLSVRISGSIRYGQYGTVRVSDQPQEAGRVHIHGPLKIQLCERASQPPLCFATG